MTRFLFIRDDGRRSNDMFDHIEDYIRNVRAPDLPDGTYSEEAWETPIRYRFPYRSNMHQWKLVRDLNVKNGKPELSFIHRDADQYKWRDGDLPYQSFDMDTFFDALDNSFDGSVYMVKYPVYTFASQIPTDIQHLHLAYKNDDGKMVDALSGDVLYNEDGETFCHIYAAAFKMKNMPIYTMFLNNNFVINKVWFRNINESDDVMVYAENNDLRESIFHPVISKGDAKIIGNQIIASEPFFIDLYGTEHWEGATGRQERGCEIVLEGTEPPHLNKIVKIESDLDYFYLDGPTLHSRYIEVRPNSIGYIKIKIEAGPFFQDFGLDFNYEFVVIEKWQ